MLRRRYHAHGDKGADAVETKSSHFSPYFAEFYLAPRERSRENSNRASKKQEKRLETYPRLFSSSLSPTPFLLLWGRILSPLSPCSLSYCSRFPHCPAMRSEASHLNEDLDASTPLHYVAWPEFICLWVPYFVGILSFSLSLLCYTLPPHVQPSVSLHACSCLFIVSLLLLLPLGCAVGFPSRWDMLARANVNWIHCQLVNRSTHPPEVTRTLVLSSTNPLSARATRQCNRMENDSYYVSIEFLSLGLSSSSFSRCFCIAPEALELFDPGESGRERVRGTSIVQKERKFFDRMLSG